MLQTWDTDLIVVPFSIYEMSSLPRTFPNCRLSLVTASLARKPRALTFSIVCAFLQMPVHFGLGGPSLCCRQLQRFQQAGSLWRNLPCEDWLAKSWQPAMGVSFFLFFSTAFALLCLSCYLCWAEWRQSVWALFSKPRKVCGKKVVSRFSCGSLVEDDGTLFFWWAFIDSDISEFYDFFISTLSFLKHRWLK